MEYLFGALLGFGVALAAFIVWRIIFLKPVGTIKYTTDAEVKKIKKIRFEFSRSPYWWIHRRFAVFDIRKVDIIDPIDESQKDLPL